MTRRSSARSTPRTSVGRCGSIRFHCSSLSQNRLLRMFLIPKRITSVWNQDCLAAAAKLMSLDPSAFDLLARNRESAAVFNQAMAEVSRLVARELLNAYNFEGVSRIVDIGGG